MGYRVKKKNQCALYRISCRIDNKLLKNLITLLFKQSSLLCSQRAHVHLHDRCQPAVHSADHLAAHRRLHRADPAAAQAADGGRRGDPEPRGGGEWSGRAGREDAGHQAAQNGYDVDSKPSQRRSHCLGAKTASLLSAVLKWLIASAGRSFSTAVAEQLRLLPLLFKVKHSLLHSLS